MCYAEHIGTKLLQANMAAQNLQEASGKLRDQKQNVMSM